MATESSPASRRNTEDLVRRASGALECPNCGAFYWTALMAGLPVSGHACSSAQRAPDGAK